MLTESQIEEIVKPWASYLTSLSLIFFFCKKEQFLPHLLKLVM